MDDPEQPSFSSFGKKGRYVGEMGSDQEPLMAKEQPVENYSLLSATFSFLFPTFGGLSFCYDIGVTSCAIITIESSEYSGTSRYDLSAVGVGLITIGSLYGALTGSIIAFSLADFLIRTSLHINTKE